MRVVVVGLGVQGKKRRAIAGDEVVATVDPVSPEAQHRRIEDVPIGSFDAALVCTPDDVKLPLLRYLLGRGEARPGGEAPGRGAPRRSWSS